MQKNAADHIFFYFKKIEKYLSFLKNRKNIFSFFWLDNSAAATPTTPAGHAPASTHGALASEGDVAGHPMDREANAAAATSAAALGVEPHLFRAVGRNVFKRTHDRAVPALLSNIERCQGRQ